MSEKQFGNLVKGFSVRNRKEWERTRFISYWVYRAGGGDDISIDEFLPLTEEESTPMSDDEIMAIIERHKKLSDG